MLVRWRRFAPPSPEDASAWDAREPSFDPAMPLPHHDVDEVRVAGASLDAARDALLAYRVYPEDLLLHRVCTPDARVAPGALIVQRVRVGPLAVEAGVRVTDAWNEPDRAGFRYVSLEGHPERGVAAFSLHAGPGGVAFRIESRSGPAAAAARADAPFARRLQRRAVREALARMRSVLEGARA